MGGLSEEELKIPPLRDGAEFVFPLLSCDYCVSDPSTSFFFCVCSGPISGCYSPAAAVVIDDSSEVIVAVQFCVFFWIFFSL